MPKSLLGISGKGFMSQLTLHNEVPIWNFRVPVTSFPYPTILSFCFSKSTIIKKNKSFSFLKAC